jgi:hypothetical protein
MTKVSAAVAVAALAGLFALGGCSIDTTGMPAVSGIGEDAGAGRDGGASDAAVGRGGSGGQGTGGSVGEGGAGGLPGLGGSGGSALGGAGGSSAGGGQGQGGQGQGGQGQGGAAGDAGMDKPAVDAPGTLGVGALCSFGDACASGFCIDGVCCESACAGTCMACAAAKTEQLDGQCRTVKAGTDPDAECDPDAANSCGRTGRCGIGACELVAKGTSCGDRSCVGHQLTAAPTCSGSGLCVTPAATACPSALKCASATACATDCTADADCVGTALCDKTDGKCKVGVALGAACEVGGTGAKACLSGHCVDGVCCESACAGTCMACDFTSTGVRNGQCAAVKPGTDPKMECQAQDPSTCGNSGACNGSGACRKYADGTACGATCCDSGPGHGARPCAFVCHAGRCDTANPVPSNDSCNGLATCCCSIGGVNAGAGNLATCSGPVACLMGGGTCM